jgi:hypothetical protein
MVREYRYLIPEQAQLAIQKNMNKLLFAFFALLAFSACGGEPTPPAPPLVDTIPPPVAPIQTNAEGLLLVVATQIAIVRQNPDIGAPEISRFRKGDTLLFANQISAHTLSMKLEGVQYDEPWLRVYLPAQPNQPSAAGWVYGGSLQFVNLLDAQVRELVIDRRIRTVLGEKWLNPLASYRRQMQQIQTSTAFHTSWQRAEALADSLEFIINNLTEQQLRKRDTLPNFFWLNDILDNSLLIHWVEEHQRYYLWHDLRYWQQKSLMTAEDADDEFIRTQIMAYASDSIEFWLPDWQIYLDKEVCSMLGSGLHRRILDSAQLALSRDTLFQPQYFQTKDALIIDVINSRFFWLPAAAAQTEIDSILLNPLLSRADRIALQARRSQLDSCQLHQLRPNVSEQGVK